MNAVNSVSTIMMGGLIGVFVIGRLVFIVLRFHQAVRESRAMPGQPSSAMPLFLAMVLLNPQLWLVVALVAFGAYYSFSHTLGESAVSFMWGLALGTPILGAIAFLGHRRRRRLASAKGSASTHVA